MSTISGKFKKIIIVPGQRYRLLTVGRTEKCQCDSSEDHFEKAPMKSEAGH